LTKESLAGLVNLASFEAYDLTSIGFLKGTVFIYSDKFSDMKDVALGICLCGEIILVVV
jgi:hypothetical protein